MQAVLRGDVGACQARFAGEILDPHRLAARPHAAGKILTAREGPAAGRVGECGNVLGGRLPHLEAAQHAELAIESPGRPELPAERRAQAAEQARQRDLQRG